jgi:hypothetical protein
MVAEYPGSSLSLTYRDCWASAKSLRETCNRPPANPSVSLSPLFLLPNSSAGHIFFSLWWTGYNFPWITYGGISFATRCNWPAGTAESPLVVPAGNLTVLADASFIWKEHCYTWSASSLAYPVLLLDTYVIHPLLSDFLHSRFQRIPHQSPMKFCFSHEIQFPWVQKAEDPAS